MIFFSIFAPLNLVLLTQSAQGFAPQSTTTNVNTCRRVGREFDLLGKHDPNEETPDRRTFLTTGVGGTMGVIGSIILPQTASAGIDLSGLASSPETSGTGSLADQLKAFDGSGATRVQEVKKAQAVSPTTPIVSSVPNVPVGVASSVTRTSTSPPSLRKAQLGTMSRFEDQLKAPTGSKFKTLSISFEFPSDWLQLDRVLGGVEFVDQRNGDKLYVLRAELPTDTNLESVDKKWFGESIFDPRGSIARANNIDEYRVVNSSLSSSIGSCPEGVCTYPRRRLGIKYATVTGNGYRVERRALVDAYEVDSVAYMLMATQNAVKFEAKGRERDTVEAMANSFRLER